MLNTYILKKTRGLDAWIGSKYDTTKPSILILGQSESGVAEPFSTYVPKWISGKLRDDTFTRIYDACTATGIPVFSGLSKAAFWDTIAFYNFISGRDPADSKLLTVAHLKSGIRPLHLVLGALRPHGVFIVGLDHARYSRPIVQHHGIPYVVVPHPRSPVTKAFLSQSFDVLVGLSTP